MSARNQGECSPYQFEATFIYIIIEKDLTDWHEKYFAFSTTRGEVSLGFYSVNRFQLIH